MPTILGVNLSPFVRKVRAFAAEKGIACDSQPVFPGSTDPEFRKKSPLGKIPCYQEGDFVLPDSSCICAYLERVHPEPALYPSDPHAYARALWYEEYADTKLIEATLPPFVERIVKTRYLNQEPDPTAIEKALGEVLPQVSGYLEEQIADNETLVDNRFTIADIAVATGFVNLQHAGERIDAARFPRLAAFVARIHSRPSFKALIEEEQAALGGA